jgi:hypothetical protein
MHNWILTSLLFATATVAAGARPHAEGASSVPEEIEWTWRFVRHILIRHFRTAFGW